MGNGCTPPPFLTTALHGSEWSASRPGRFTSGETAPCTYCVGDWVGPRAGPDIMEKRKHLLPLPGIEPRLLGRTVRSVVAVPTELA
jgi:hypothetical protein